MLNIKKNYFKYFTENLQLLLEPIQQQLHQHYSELQENNFLYINIIENFQLPVLMMYKKMVNTFWKKLMPLVLFHTNFHDLFCWFYEWFYLQFSIGHCKQ